MQLIYFSNDRIPGLSACAIQQLQMCEAFANAGADVTLIRPYYFELAEYAPSMIREFYGVEENFVIKTLPTLLSLSKPNDAAERRLKIRIPWIGGASMLLATWFYIVRKVLTGEFNRPTIIYSRNLNAAAMLLRMRGRWLSAKPVSVFFEVHTLVQQPERFFEYVLKRANGLVCITRSLKEKICQKYDVDAAKILVAPDGVRDDRLTEPQFSKADARVMLNISGNYEKVVLYTGQILPGKGVEVFIDAAADFDEKILFLIVGGAPARINEIRTRTRAERLKNVQFAGSVPPHSVALYQAAADVLVLPNTQDSAISPYTSPLKLFEYMAAKRPIVASDLPVLREVLCDSKNAILFPAGDSTALAKAVRRVLAEELMAEKLAAKAFADVRQYACVARASRILSFIKEQANWPDQDNTES